MYAHLLRQIPRHANTKHAIYRSTTAADATEQLRKKPEILAYFCDQLLNLLDMCGHLYYRLLLLNYIIQLLFWIKIMNHFQLLYLPYWF